MNIRCELMFEYENDDTAKNIENALAIDNMGFLTTSVSGNLVRGSINERDYLSLLHTLDDFLSCLSVAEKVMEGLK